MKTEDLTPLLLDVVIQFLDSRPIGTKFHPRKNEYIVDTRLMARIIRHGGRLSAQLDGSETKFFMQLLSYLAEKKTVSSSIHMGKYYCERLDDYTRLVLRVKKLGVFNRNEGFAPLLNDDLRALENGKEEEKWASPTQ